MNEKFGKKNWAVLLIFGLIGQIAWSVENMYFNLFVYEEVAPSLDTVTLMVQLSGIVATIVTLIAGTLSDKTGNRRSFICWGYIIWGVTVALFGTLSPQNMGTLFGMPFEKAVRFCLVAVVVGDCIMTLFGSTANDACFNAWVTDNTNSSYRGKTESVLSILPLGAMLIVAGGFGILVEAIGYTGVFLALGVVITVCGVGGLFLIKDGVTLSQNGTFKDIFYGFKPSVIKSNAPLYLALLVMGVYSVACQIFMPYLIIYMKTYLGFSVFEYSVVFGAAIVFGALINLFLGKKADETDKTKMMYLAAVILSAGLLGMYFAKDIGKTALLILFGIFGFVMITGYILYSALCGATVRDYTPAKDVGKLQGVRMVFSVLIPMVFGPMIGNAINKARNIPLENAGADAMTTAFVPAPEIFLVGAITAALSLLLIPILRKSISKNKTNSTPPLNTDYETGEIPFPEYPRPQLERKEWLNLNGKWEFSKAKLGETPTHFSTILVPYSPESQLSGIGNGFTLNSGEYLFYRRAFTLKDIADKATLLHFGAVDSVCEVFINGERAGSHRGGYTPFTLDITELVKSGENELVVKVTDDLIDTAKGKQSKKRGGIWYTEQSGIWQSVWLETPVKNYIKGLKYDFEKGKVIVSATSNGINQTITVFDKTGAEIARADFTEKAEIAYDFEYWSPEDPTLYSVVITNDDGDEVKSYFGYRFFSQGVDKRGKARLYLNGKPYFFSGVLDQGYWPDGLLTPPCDKAMQDELEYLKRAGFNTVRKHIKIEPLRWYYHCDRIGLTVWQDFVNGGGEYDFMHIAVLPFLGFTRRDDDYKYFSREDEDGRVEFENACVETINHLYNCPSISLWTIFNEGWGQFDSKRITDAVKLLDSSRLIDSVSGWHDQGEENTTLKSLHIYYTPLKVPKDSRPVVLSEFGGYSHKISGHVYDEDTEFGYKKFKSTKALNEALEKLYLDKLLPLVKKGLCGAIYTQVSDVEEEINGLITYDRKVIKINEADMKKLNDALYSQMEN